MGYKKGVFTSALECAISRVQEQEELKWNEPHKVLFYSD